MKADLVIRGIAQLVTPEGPGPKHGAAMRHLKIVEHAALAIADGKILWVGPEADWSGEAAASIDVGHRAVIPGLVDPHTHAVECHAPRGHASEFNRLRARMQQMDSRRMGLPHQSRTTQS